MKQINYKFYNYPPYPTDYSKNIMNHYATYIKFEGKIRNN